tara:strand:- start:59 stop:604 length:546 start_codon:yes stop_codon:yes gene_type:complete
VNKLIDFDIFLFSLINSSGDISFDSFMIFMSNKFVFIPLYVYILFVLYKSFTKDFVWILLSISFLIFLADFGSVKFFKEVFERLRPCYQLENVRIVLDCGGKYGFISSHSANMFSIAFFIGLLTKRIKLFIFLFSLATIIGYSRVYLGVHFPFDILGGMIWAIIVSFISFTLLKIKLNETI